MKKTITTLALFFACVLTLMASDETYVKALESAIAQMKAAKSVDELQAVANKFEMIGDNTAGEWLPDYYAAICYAHMSFMEKDARKRDQYVTKAETLLEPIKAENDELYVMRAYVAMANMAIDGQNRWQKQGAIFQTNLKQAEKLNPENPRVYYLQGTNLLHTPASFGGGTKNACPVLQKAKAKFEAFKPASSIAPNWGKEDLERYIAQCK